MQIFVQKLNPYKTFYVFSDKYTSLICTPFVKNGKSFFLYRETQEDGIEGFLLYGETKMLPKNNLFRLAMIKKAKLTLEVSFEKMKT